MRRPVATALALAITTAAVPAAASATHKPGHGKGSGDSLTLAAKPNPVVYGSPVALTGRLTAADNVGKNLLVESDPSPYDGFSNEGNAATGAGGQYSFNVSPGSNTRYRVRQGNLFSPIVTVLVRIRIGLRVSDPTPDRGERVRFFGRACPEHVGALVRLQRRAAGRWATVARTRTRDGARCATYSRRVRVGTDGRYRAVVAGDSDHARGISNARVVDVDD